MTRRTPGALAFLGLDADDEALHRLLGPFAGEDLTTVAANLELEPDELRTRLAPLIACGLVRLAGTQLLLDPPAQAIGAVLADQADTVRAIAEGLDRLGVALPTLTGALPEPGPPGPLVEGELRVGGDPRNLLTSWMDGSTGDLLWMRPDQWRMPEEPRMVAAVARAIESGRRSRAIYPVRVLEDAPQALAQRIEVGEEVRLVAEVPSRLAIIGDAGALVPEVWGETNNRRVLVRQPGLRAALTALFEELWSRGVVLPGATPGGRRTPLDRLDNRRLLLDQLAHGAKDEQMARTLGISLRTVRRRVAELLDELGVESRFQAGAEAVRRGWI